MPLYHFDIFVRTITGLPITAVIKALDLEAKMLDDDCKNRPFTSRNDAFSILSFRQFVRTAKLGEAVLPVKSVPPDHAAFYKKTIGRLVQANELPPIAMEQFDLTFPPIL
jgi:hypothetical protein